MKQIKARLKIRHTLWLLIKSGAKSKEFRKLVKGLETGYYELVSLDEKEIYGTVYLTPLELNPKLVRIAHCNSGKCIDKEFCDCDENSWSYEYFYYKSADAVKFEDEGWDHWFEFEDYYNSGIFIDKETYEFVKENYIDKNFDFIVYKISKVEALDE